VRCKSKQRERERERERDRERDFTIHTRRRGKKNPKGQEWKRERFLVVNFGIA
jgi:hypothetical protein